MLTTSRKLACVCVLLLTMASCTAGFDVVKLEEAAAPAEEPVAESPADIAAAESDNTASGFQTSGSGSESDPVPEASGLASDGSGLVETSGDGSSDGESPLAPAPVQAPAPVKPAADHPPAPTPAAATEQVLQKALADVTSAEKHVTDTRALIDAAQAGISTAAAAQDYEKAGSLKKEKETHMAELSKAQAKLAAAKAHLREAQQAHRRMKLGEGTPFAGAVASESLSSYSSMIQAPLWKWKDKIDAAVAVVSTAISHAAAHGSVNVAITEGEKKKEDGNAIAGPLTSRQKRKARHDTSPASPADAIKQIADQIQNGLQAVGVEGPAAAGRSWTAGTGSNAAIPRTGQDQEFERQGQDDQCVLSAAPHHKIPALFLASEPRRHTRSPDASPANFLLMLCSWPRAAFQMDPRYGGGRATRQRSNCQGMERQWWRGR